jgi:aminopeptidase N
VGLVGEPAFLAGLREYFAMHAGGNGNLAALLAALSPHAPIDLVRLVPGVVGDQRGSTR